MHLLKREVIYKVTMICRQVQLTDAAIPPVTPPHQAFMISLVK